MIYNPIAWGSSIGTIEGTISSYSNQVLRARKAGQTIYMKMQSLDSAIKGTIEFLEDELVIIAEWQQDVENVEDTLSHLSVEELRILKEVFMIGIDDLEITAQSFLDRPKNVFGNGTDDIFLLPSDNDYEFANATLEI